MARTKPRVTYVDRDPTATPHELSTELYADANDCYAYPITSAEDIVMFIPGGRYPYDGDVSENTDWLREGNYERLWKTVQAFEKLGALLDGEDGKRIVKYRGRDEATGFPLMERPLGGPLMKFYTRHCSAMWQTSSSIAPAYLHLVYRWSLQILSALATIHKKGIIHMEIGSLKSHWLREDLSLALVGFMSADFVNTRGERAQGDDNDELRLA